jgi:regulatory protein
MKITAVKKQIKKQDRYSVFVDEKYSFSLSETALIESGLHSGMELSPAELDDLKRKSGLDKAYGNALRYVVMRPRSEWEMADYLRRKGLDAEAGEQIAERLRKIGLLDDLAFARAWVANRRLLKITSKRKLQMELKQKRVTEEIAAKVLAEDETDERETLRQLVEKKQARYPDRQKLMQYLMRQGFSYDDIKSVLTGSNA